MISESAPDAELVSPMFARMVARGHSDLRVVLGSSVRRSAQSALARVHRRRAKPRRGRRCAHLGIARLRREGYRPRRRRPASGDSAYICGGGCLSRSGRWRSGSSSAAIRVVSAVGCTFTPHSGLSQRCPASAPVAFGRRECDVGFVQGLARHRADAASLTHLQHLVDDRPGHDEIVGG